MARMIARGEIVEVEERSYVGRDGTRQDVFDAYLAADNPRYGADRISGPAALRPSVGDYVELVCTVTAKVSQRSGQPYLSIWAVADARAEREAAQGASALSL